MDETKTNIPQGELNDEAIDGAAGGGNGSEGLIVGRWTCKTCGFIIDFVCYESQWTQNASQKMLCLHCTGEMDLKKLSQY